MGAKDSRRKSYRKIAALRKSQYFDISAEPLERRVMLSASISGSTLTETATSGDDWIVVSQSGSTLSVSENGTVQNFDATGITLVSVAASTGNDNVYMGTLTINAYANLDAGNDTCTTGSGADTVLGGAGDDYISTGPGADSLSGQDGNDSLLGGGGPDTLSGGNGTDMADYGSRAANVTASLDGVANDGVTGEFDNILTDVEEINGGSGNDTLTGGPGNDYLIGNAGNDSLSGLDGNDTMVGGTGNDTMSGGAGAYDTVDYSLYTASQPVDVTLDGVANDGQSGETDNVLTDVEIVLGGAGNDTISAAGDTTGVYLVGNAGNDSLLGGAGNDTMIAGAGNDTMDGGSAGFDEVDYSAYTSSQPINVSLDGVANDGQPGVESDNVAASISIVLGGAGNDTISAGATSTNNVYLVGNAGNDLLTGAGGNDSLYGGDGNDSISGMDGNDYIVGNNGNDTLAGGNGNDTLDGGLGADYLSGGAGTDLADYSNRTENLFLEDTSSVLYSGSGNGAEGDRISGDIENIAGGSGSDTIVGGTSDNHIFWSNGGNDSLAGNYGNDTFYIKDGYADTVDGSLGYNTANVDSIDSLIRINSTF